MLNTKDLKIILVVEKLIRESTSETLLEPDVDRFEQISQMVNINDDICREALKEVKKRLGSRHSKTL